MEFSINKVLDELKKSRTIFTSEADFQLALAQEIKNCYPKAEVRLEYCPSFDTSMHIDILVLWPSDNNVYKWIPIELKYKTKKYYYTDEKECAYDLKEQSAQDCGCYDYLLDISRIERIKREIDSKFKTGYAIFLTNDHLYKNGPRNEKSNYYIFRIADDRSIQNEKLSWPPDSQNFGSRANSIQLSGSYIFTWQKYSDDHNPSFIILVNEIYP